MVGSSRDLIPLFVASLLTAAVVGKSLAFGRFRQSLERRLGSRSLALQLALGVVTFEAAIAITLLTPLHRVAALTLIPFLGSSTIWLVAGGPAHRDVVFPDCSCFGPGTASSWRRSTFLSSAKPAWWSLRNGVISGLCLAVIAPNTDFVTTLSAGIALICGLCVVVMTWTIFDLRGRFSADATADRVVAVSP